MVRVPGDLGKEIFLRLPSTKSTEFEVKNRRKNAIEANAEHLLQLLCSLFEEGINRI